MVGKVLFATGAARGLGKAIVERFLKDDYRILAFDVHADNLASAQAEWSAEERVITHIGDVRQRNDIQQAVDEAVAKWGRIDVLANVAGIAVEEEFLDIQPETWQRIIDINLTGVFNVAQIVARQMTQQSSGVIINMSSKNGICAEVKYAHYNASKAGVILLTQTMAIDLAPYGIRVNDAVGELIFHNRYSYANNNPVNLTDPSGLCAQPTQWWNPVDTNCYYSAVGLAQRFSQGNPQTYNAWFDVLIQREWHELKAIEVLGSSADFTGTLNQFMRNSSIIPSLFISNPRLALQAVQQWGCQNNLDFSFLGSFAVVGGTAGSLPGTTAGGVTIGGAPVVLAAFGGLAVGIIISLLFAGTAAENPEEDPCSEEKMAERIGNRSVAQVVYESALGDRINGKRIKPTDLAVQKVGGGSVAQYASWACNGSPFPPIDLYPGRRYDAIDEGHTRFVASRLINIPVGVSGVHRPTTSFDYMNGDFVAAFEWREIEWK